MKWRRVILVGGGGIFLVCLALPFLPYFWRVSQATLARQRWKQNGADDYTLVVTRYCSCPNAGEYKLTIQDGLVTDVELLGNTLSGGNPLMPPEAWFLTVENMLIQAERVGRSSWGVPWLSSLSIDYDPTYGYVTRYTSEANGWLALFTGPASDSGSLYTARDLQFIEP